MARLNRRRHNNELCYQSVSVDAPRAACANRAWPAACSRGPQAPTPSLRQRCRARAKPGPDASPSTVPVCTASAHRGPGGSSRECSRNQPPTRLSTRRRSTCRRLLGRRAVHSINRWRPTAQPDIAASRGSGGAGGTSAEASGLQPGDSGHASVAASPGGVPRAG
jgi:hypothetical protein